MTEEKPSKTKALHRYPPPPEFWLTTQHLLGGLTPPPPLRKPPPLPLSHKRVLGHTALSSVTHTTTHGAKSSASKARGVPRTTSKATGVCEAPMTLSFTTHG